MRQLLALELSLVAGIFLGGTPAQPAEAPASQGIELAKQELSRVKSLVEVGALPRVRITQAEADLADAQDEVILAHALYGDLPESGAGGEASAGARGAATADAGQAASADAGEAASREMLAAAQRRVDRQQARLDEARKMVDAGVTARSYLTSFEAELTARQTSLDLAHLRARLIAERASELASIAQHPVASLPELPADNRDLLFQGMERYDGSGVFEESRDLQPLELAFQSKFAHPLPISADGETEVHRTLGFDHRGRVDVAVRPEQPEGIWLRQYLKLRGIPYYAFARAIPGKATAAHIHIGPGSTRLHSQLVTHLPPPSRLHNIHNAD
ncbi:MAG: hypothetical protein JOZ32_16970 [Bryobacterales bacterium]|nr:hypothetical protein [Bryobacterales bacterium]